MDMVLLCLTDEPGEPGQGKYARSPGTAGQKTMVADKWTGICQYDLQACNHYSPSNCMMEKTLQSLI